MIADTYNVNSITSPALAFTEDGWYVRVSFWPTVTLIVFADTATMEANVAAITEKRITIKEYKVHWMPTTVVSPT